MEETVDNPIQIKPVVIKTGIRNTRLKRSIVPIEQWLQDPYYLGPEVYAIRPYWKEILERYFKEDKKEYIFSGSSRSGKSYATAILLIRYIYETYCWESFPSLFGLSPTTKPKIVWFSFSRQKADSTGIKRLQRMIDNIPFFNDCRERRRRDIASEVDFPWIEIISGVNVSHAIGDDVLGAIIDEANVRNVAKADQVEEAHHLFLEIRMRSQTTYTWKGIWGGFAGIVSTAETTSSFVDSELRKAKADGSMFTVEAAVYDVNPEGFSEERFDVYCGDGDIPAFIVDECTQEIATTIATSYGLTPQQYASQYPDNVAHPPENLRKFYREDISYAIRNLSGRSQATSGTLFNRASVLKSIFIPPKDEQPLLNPCSSKMPNLGIYDTEDLTAMLSEAIINSHYDGEPVYGHNDISKKNDHTGVAFLFYSKQYRKIMPIWYSAVYYNRSIMDNEIDQTKVFQIMLILRNMGVNIKYVSADFYASDYYIQQAKLILGNDHAGRLSVDENPAAYLSVLNYARKNMYWLYQYEQLSYELAHLQYDKMTGKVDHPHNPDSENPIFFKDVGDAIAGASFHILTRENIAYDDLIVKEEAEKARQKAGLKEEDFFEDLAEDDGYYGAIAKNAEEGTNKVEKSLDSCDDIANAFISSFEGALEEDL